MKKDLSSSLSKKEKVNRRGKMRYIRFSAQLSLLMVFVALAWMATYPPSSKLAENIFLRAEPLNALLSRGGVNGFLYMLPALALITLTLFSGRFFCAWICPLGTCFDSVPSRGWWEKKSFNSLKPKDLGGRTREEGHRRLRVKYLIMLLIVILYIVNINLVWLVNPLAIANQAAVFAFSGVIPVIFLLLLALAILYRPRFWCSELCPTGALFSAISFLGKRLPEKIIPLSLVKNDQACVHCGKCALSCPLEIVEVAETHRSGRLAIPDCSLCGDCVDACPQAGALSLSSFGKRFYVSRKSKKEKVELKEERLSV